MGVGEILCIVSGAMVCVCGNVGMCLFAIHSCKNQSIDVDDGDPAPAVEGDGQVVTEAPRVAPAVSTMFRSLTPGSVDNDGESSEI